MTNTWVLSALAVLATASTVSAQSLFVDGTAFAAIEQRAHVTASQTVTTDLSETVAGGGFAIGTALTPRYSLRLELAFPGELSQSNSDTIVIPTEALGVSLPYAQQVESSERVRTASTLVAYHTGRRHGVQLAYLGGAAFVWRRQVSELTTSYPEISYPTLGTLPATILAPIVTLVPRTNRIEATDYGVTAQVGVDADISLGARLSAVPQVRVLGFNGALSVHPGVAVRVRW